MIEGNATERHVEQNSDLTVPVFRYVDPSEQIVAARAFVASIKNYVQDQEKAQYIAEVECLLAESGDANYAKRLAINCFDFCISDEIRTYEPSTSLPTDAAAVYFRSDVYKAQYPRCVNEAIVNRIGYTPTESVIAPIALINTLDMVGSKGALTERVGYIVGSDTEDLNKPYPPLGMPRQELCSELLSCGINPIEDVENSRTSVDSNENRAYRRLHRIRGSLALHATESDLESHTRYIESHWTAILGESDERGHAVLLSSGVSSNEASMRAIAEISNRVYVHPYWYYENIARVSELFTSVEQDLSEATALLINIEPTNFFTFEGRPESPISTMKQFVAQAIQNQREQYSLIIDATVDPLFSVKSIIGGGELPANLVVVKTVSATKHQDGGRNHFFGVAYTNDVDVYDRIKQKRRAAGSVLYESQIIHFPLPSRKRIERRRLITSRLGSALEALNMGQDGWKYESYSYHSFLMPPQTFIEHIVEEVRRLGTKELAEEYMRNINNEIYAIVGAITREEGKDVEVGDSFAFPVTRVNTQGGPNHFGPYELALKIPRISMGYRDGSVKGMEFAERLIEEMNRRL